MSKAKEKAKEYTEKFILTVDHQSDVEEAYIDGYHQAEKDLELGWEDINNIKLIIEQVESDYIEQDEKLYSKYFYQEVLKRFNQERNK